MLVGCAIAMTVLLVNLHPQPVPDFLTTYGDQPQAAAFYAVYTVYIGSAASEFMVLIVRYLRTATPSQQLRISLRLEIAGAVFATLWCAWGAARTIANAYHVGRAFNVPSVAEILSGVCLALMTLGAAWAVWAIKALEIWSWWATRRIAPLWERLRPVGEQYILPFRESRIRAQGAVSGTRHRPKGRPPSSLILYRRIIEIRDWQYQLRVYVHPDLSRWAAALAHARKLNHQDSATLLEAAEIASALEAREAGRRYHIALEGNTMPSELIASQLSEARSLIRLENTIRTSSLVAALCCRARQQALTGAASSRNDIHGQASIGSTTT
jgi:hypothetical protein